ncbi:MAG TPA: PEP-CTERM sorting domain-containing protein [Casimicrobiaceae bacterium]|nr:PEP-CTERM sorting domain-containing protein [Casimicrobiaceae bacterium]
MRPSLTWPALESLFAACAVGFLLVAGPAAAGPFVFSTGNPDGRIATATRPDSAGKFEIETGDDFLLDQATGITSASFTGIVAASSPIASIGEVRVEIYRVFPQDSDTSRTSGPTFSTSKVPARLNSPSDVEFDDRDTASGNLTFTTTDLGSFGVLNSVLPGGIHALPNIFTGGDGAVTGEEVQFNVSFTSAFVLPAGHYFFVPQVEIAEPDGEFLWLSAPKPIVPPGTPFLPDLQTWTRDQFLDPDWLRVGTDIVGGNPAPTFNAVFSLAGEAVQIPEPGSLLLIAGGLAVLWWAWKRRH